MANAGMGLAGPESYVFAASRPSASLPQVAGEALAQSCAPAGVGEAASYRTDDPSSPAATCRDMNLSTSARAGFCPVKAST